ncbi:MAG: flavodoxin-dependent (E)-4-hydroxy-3-methylbut-2-enyl-diphosphate synthase [Anaerovoracaceae bacterium]
MTKKIRCGDLYIGGDFPITIQSMTNTDTRDVKSTLLQIEKLREAGCEIIRLAVPDMEAAQAFGEIKTKIKMPMVADIHFDYRLAIEAIKMGADKIRINPGNIGSVDRVKAVVDMAKSREIPIRIGVNSGSLEKDILEKEGGVTANGLVESAIRNVRLLEDLDFGDIVISLKASDPKMNYDGYMSISKMSDYPLHIGVTEAGTVSRGKIKSAVGIGALLLAGVGDTMRVSLTGDPVNEIYVAKSILASAGIKKEAINLVSCPTCGRTCVDLSKITDELEEKLVKVTNERIIKGLPELTVAVMGCVVNGPGEARSADLGVACGIGEGLLFIKGKTIRKVKEEEICNSLIDMVKNYERYV